MAKKPKKIISKKEPEQFTFFYTDLVNEYPNWQRIFETAKERNKAMKSPSDEDLQMAVLFRILMLLRDIKDDIKRERTIK